MYALSTEAKESLQTYTLSGTIGELTFDDENVLKGSLRIANKCADSSTFSLGGVYIGTFQCSFMGLNVDRNDWKNLPITLEVTINDAETFPIGTWFVDKAEHTKGIVKIKAYDAMLKFNKKVSVDVGAFGTMYEWLMLACEQCNVTLGMTESQVEALPNGNMTFYLEEMGDIEEWRDVLFWLSNKVVGFATINRDGELILVKYHNTVDDTLEYDVRFNTSSYGDEVITYTGVSVYVVADQRVYYYHNDPDDGYTLKLGHDPFMQVTKAQRETYIENILANIDSIEYNSCDVTIPFGAQYDLGDVLKFPNGQGSSTDKFCIMSYSWTYYGGYRIKSISGQKASMSKTDKNVQGLLESVNSNEFTSYESRNVSEITIGNNESERLLMARIASNNSTKAQIHIEINLESVANTPVAEFEDFADIWDAISNTAVKGEITYFINSEEVSYYPAESYIDGKHVLHLMYILPLEANNVIIFEVYMRSIGGTITIGQGDVWFYASGAGLVGDGKWDGTLNIIDEVEGWTITNMTFASASDSVTAETQTPVNGGNLSDTASGWTIPAITFESAEDSMYIEMHTDVFRRITEDGNVRVTENDDVRYIEGD